MQWDPETQRIFNEMVDQDTPPEYRMMARVVIGELAEKYAKLRASDIIESPDIVHAFVEGCPGQFQEDMWASLNRHNLSPDQDLLSSPAPAPAPKKARKVTRKASRKQAKRRKSGKTKTTRKFSRKIE